ncbi:coat protein [Xylophilus sp. Kf1]|nr:coat protein [Xylophilus sp. Kf1]
MSLVLTKTAVAANAATGKQWESVQGLRAHFDASQKAFAELPHLNPSQQATNAAAVLPRDVWREFDSTTKTIMTSDEGGPLLADLMPLAKPVSIGKIVAEYRTRSDSGASQSSISGQLAKQLDKGVYDYEGGLVLIHDSGFGREWREVEGQRSEGFDALSDDQSNATRAVTRGIVSHIVNGVPNVKFKGYEALGIKTSGNVASLDLAIDLTATATTFAQIEAVFISALQLMQATNFVKTPLTFYVSSAIWFNLLRRGTTDAAFETFLSGLQRLPGIAAIKLINDTSVLSGNEFFAIPLSSEHIQPVVGMGVTTTPIQRLHPFADFNFVTWGAVGILIKADFTGKKGVLWAREIA